MTPDALRAAGEALYGRWGWQTRMAKALRVDASTVRRWLSGASAVPGPAEVALELLLEKKRRGEAECASSPHAGTRCGR